ncbi:polysaccharide pyruvyl transferase family protein [Blastopirellula sp. JC732]|uniref:Polysaccharide pyruvyl transferase family protein n=1 Tax=Blastopirellula sediminis TaxID=2894196 RepID=A0A9X1MSB9_9BACT|nr:polysaccharide pyruvyl transferase family protein [Blastopirellula sediminis]MCC9605108.1 polysaccharide pyruvyl transferase family protein [Blastopirellula sediminis]MCC9631592.1 polysaccharide pyruvyl transferase family protein [Blastopirellula sediminis]
MTPASISRRQALGILGLSALGASRLFAAESKPKRILLRSSWQTINIGDIAHTPGVLRLISEYLPETEVTLWPSKVDNGVDELLMANFPQLRIIKDKKQLSAAFDDCDFLLHGSGASLVAENDVRRWAKETGKPYGIYGITFPPKKSHQTTASSEKELASAVEMLNGARFVYFRDSRSLAFAKEKGAHAPIMQFGPDGAFACDLRDDAKADAFLKKHDLETGKFLCCIPRLRYTPSWIYKKTDVEPDKHARNEEMKEHDHAPLRQAIIDVVTKTDMKVLVCPEDQTQMQIGKEMLVDKLPAAVRKRVVWRPNYWLTGEAVSVYIRSAGLFGNEMHSPIMCIGHGVPAVVCRWAEQTTKGYMWDDIGLSDWLFDMDDPASVAKIAPTVLNIAQHPAAAKEKAVAAQHRVEAIQAETMAVLGRELAKT